MWNQVLNKMSRDRFSGANLDHVPEKIVSYYSYSQN